MEYNQLPHTGLRVPATHADIAVTSTTELPNGDGLSAVIRRGSQTLGVITIFEGFMRVRLEVTSKDRRMLERCAERCRDRDGHPLPSAEVWDLLVAERRYQQAIDDAQREQRVLARVFHEGEAVTLHSIGAYGPVLPGWERLACLDVHYGPDVERVEAWIDDQWTQIFPEPGT